MKTKKNTTQRIYGAYGSNLNLQQMAWRCPDAKPLITGYVENYRLTFRRGGYANVEKADGGRVPVLLWEISETDEKALDRYEGYPRFYVKVDLPVESEDGMVTAMFYVMAQQYTARPELPTDRYWHTLVDGYLSNGLPYKYLADALNGTIAELSDENRS